VRGLGFGRKVGSNGGMRGLRGVGVEGRSYHDSNGYGG
jgi:hypothetical protein